MGASVPAHLLQQKEEAEVKEKEETKKQLPFNGAPIGTVINTIKANTPAGEDPVYPEGYTPKHPTPKQPQGLPVGLMGSLSAPTAPPACAA